MMPRGLKVNNPGNVRKSGEKWQGETVSEDAAFKRFDTLEHGARAAAKIVLNYQRLHHLETIDQIIGRWAPPIENNTNAYAKFVADAVGVGVTAVFPLNVNTLAIIMQAIFRMEQGKKPDGTWWVPDNLGEIGAKAVLK